MRKRTALRRAPGLVLALALSALVVPLETAPAEAGRIKVRVRSTHAAAKVDEHQTARPGSPHTVRIRPGSGSSAADARDDQGARPRPLSAAAAAAARARAALEAEKAQATKGVVAGATPQPLPSAKTTDYGNGVTCIAGC